MLFIYGLYYGDRNTAFILLAVDLCSIFLGRLKNATKKRTKTFYSLEVSGPYGPLTSSPCRGLARCTWWAPIVRCGGANASASAAKKNGSQLKKNILLPFSTPNDPKNQSYIAIPFICHLWECSVTTQSWVIGPYKNILFIQVT